MSEKLPTGLLGAYSALSGDGRGLDCHDQLTSLVWFRQISDPSLPLVGGHDPRTILDPGMTWDELVELPAPLLTILSARLNDVMGDGLLSMDWHELGDEPYARALREVGRWSPAGKGHTDGDLLGYVSQTITSASAKSARGAFYTPYSVSLMMAMVSGIEPGKSVMDPCCGSGSMLLAALDACRQAHGPDAVPEVFGIDIDPRAVRVCRLNLALAGIAPAGRITCANALTHPPLERAIATENIHENIPEPFQLGLDL